MPNEEINPVNDAMSEPEHIKLFIDDREVRNFNRETKVKEIIYLLLDSNEGYLFLGDAEEPLELEIMIGEIGIEKHGHVHATHCHRVEVTFEYAGKSKCHKFPSTAKIKTVRDWTVSQDWEPVIDPAERPKFALFLPDDDSDPLPEARRIGTYVAKGECQITFELAYQERQQG